MIENFGVISRHFEAAVYVFRSSHKPSTMGFEVYEGIVDDEDLNSSMAIDGLTSCWQSLAAASPAKAHLMAPPLILDTKRIFLGQP